LGQFGHPAVSSGTRIKTAVSGDRPVIQNFSRINVCSGVLIVAAIKITLSTERRRRAPSIEAEAGWLRRQRSLWYELNVRPRRAGIGDWVYFIRDGAMVARSHIAACEWKDASEMGGTYTGEKVERSCFRIKVNQMELAKRPLLHQGFQGFRYVTPQEERRFEVAFTGTEKVRSTAKLTT
jgi:hypothetical protein